MNDNFRNHEDKIAALLNQTAENINPNPHFTEKLERDLTHLHVQRSKPAWFHFTRKQVVTTLAWTVSLVAFALFMNWAISTVAPVPTSVPAANDTSVPPATEKPSINNDSKGTPVPNANGYDWRETKLYLNAPLPDAPSEVSLYSLKAEQFATVDSARALAERFGLQGEIYSRGMYPTDKGYFFTDGKQSLIINSDLYFTYTADMSQVYNNFKNITSPNAEVTINDFLQSHGFNFPHKVEKASLYTGYEVVPLSTDGMPMRYEFFSSRPMHVILDENGQVLQLESNLMDYETFGTQKYSIISAKEAFDKLFDDSILGGKIESTISASIAEPKEWQREYPLNEPITMYGYASSIPALDSSKPAFNQIDGYAATGDTSGFSSLEPNTFIEATGQFITENGIKKFNVESWKSSPYQQDGLVGTLKRENGQTIFTTDQGEQLTIQPDLPADLPIPFENAFVVGVRKGNTYEWTLVDDRMSGSGGGGGGGGGGQGFYKLNLTGSPVPFPSPQPTPGLGDGTYVVQSGDTLTGIAQAHGITVDELMQANGMTDSLIFVGQKLIIQGGTSVQPEAGQKIEGQQGLLNVTIYKKQDGSQRFEYSISYIAEGAAYSSMAFIEGDNLQSLQTQQNRPIKIWGTIDRYDPQYGAPIIKVERFEIPFPDLQFKILRGTQKVIAIDNQTNATLFTTNEGTSYIQTIPSGEPDTATVGKENDEVILETLAIPGETIGEYPTIRVFSAAMAISPKDGQPIDLPITADQIYTYEETEPTINQPYTPPALTIEKVELMYFVTNPHWQVDHLDGSPLYMQPVWRFYGHYDTGGEFDLIVQALKQEYLKPELDTYVPGG